MSRLFVGLGLAYIVVLLAIEVAWSPRYIARIKQRLASGDGAARRELYRFVIVFEWIAAPIALALLLAGGATVEQLGLQLPPREQLGDQGPIIVGMTAGMVGAALAVFLAQRRARRIPVAGDIDVLIPRTSAERGWFAAVAVTAGVTEEVLYRALPIIVLAHLLPELSPLGWVAIAAIAFGLAHVYQGVAGVAATALLGGIFGVVFVETRSLLPGMALHALLDLRLLLVAQRHVPPPAPPA